MATARAEHLETLQEIQAKDAAEKERVQMEHAVAMKSLSEALQQEHEIALEQKNACWQDQLERMKEQHIRALHAERDQHQALLDALNETRPNPPRNSGEGSQADTSNISEELDLETSSMVESGALDDDEPIG
jgi:hypothetical protein